MPQVVPLPLGGLATEIGTLAEAERQLETKRTGVATITSTATGTLPASASSLAAVVGWPTLTATMQSTGGALYFCGFTVIADASTPGVNFGLSIDGNNPNVEMQRVGTAYTGSTLVPVVASLVWWEPVTLETHTFEIYAGSNGGGTVSVTIEDPFIVVVPV